MAQFLGDIAFALWTALFVGGLIAWHVGSKEAAGLIKTAATIMIVMSIGGGACTSYFWFQYQRAGEFDTAYPSMMRATDDTSMRQLMRMRTEGEMPMEQMRSDGMQGRPMTRSPAEESLTPEQQELLKDPNKHPM
ncbi:MAG: hypothetical protein RIC29_00055 [Rhodospirillaceae bacterium]